jgi:hypothetical protein
VKGFSFLPASLISFDCFHTGSASTRSPTKSSWTMRRRCASYGAKMAERQKKGKSMAMKTPKKPTKN